MSIYEDYGLSFNLFPKQLLMFSHPDMVPENYEIPNEVLFGGAAGGGKGSIRGEKIITPYGVKKWEDIKEGDMVCDPLGTTQEVIEVHPWENVECYRVSFNDGSSVIVSEGHLWNYWATNTKSKKLKQYKDEVADGSMLGILAHTKVATTKQLKEKFDKYALSTRIDSEGYSRVAHLKIPICNPVTFTKSYKVPQIVIPPYVLGMLLGDGYLGASGENKNSIRVSEKESGDLKEILGFFNQDGCSVFDYHSAKNASDDYIAPIVGDTTIQDGLKYLCLSFVRSDNKFIPEAYMLSSIDNRYKLLQGLMDSDGYANPDKCSAEFCSTSKQLAEDVAFLVRSLGGYASISSKPEPYYKKASGEKVYCTAAWRVYISAPDLSKFFRLSRKKERARKQANGRNYFGKVITGIESVGVKEMRCITVSSWHGLYLTNDFTVTHNSYSMRAMSIILALECPGVNVFLFRKTYTELKTNHLLGPSGFQAMLATAVQRKLVRIDSQNNIIQFKNGPSGSFAGGSIIYLRHVQYEKDVYIYQGAEIHVLMIDEATHFSEPIYNFLRGRVRIGNWSPPEKWKKWFPRIICASNPGSSFHNLWKHMFVDFVDKDNIYRPKRAPIEEGGMLRQYIPATVYDNPALLKEDPGYIDRLKGLGSPELVKAMLEGNWDIVAGGMFDDLWRRDVHVVEPFRIPKGWYINRCFDWGSSKPFAVLWVAESNGEPVEYDDGTFYKFPPGTLFVIDEWYGNDKRAKDPNTGLFMSNNDIGAGIKYREDNNTILAPISSRINPGPADNSIYTVINNVSQSSGINAGFWGNSGRSRADIFFPSDKSPGSRVKRWSLIRDRLACSHDIKLGKPMERPGLFVFNVCNDLIRTLPTAPRDEKKMEDIDTASEDHLLDALGYRVLQARAGVGRMGVRLG